MKQIAIMFRLMQFYTHNAHNLVARIVFFSDHEYLGELYEAYDAAYDSIIERIIGLYGRDSIDLVLIQREAIKELEILPNASAMKENSHCFQVILDLEKKLCQLIEDYCQTPGLSQGVIQLLGNHADNSEMRQYKLKSRLIK